MNGRATVDEEMPLENGARQPDLLVSWSRERVAVEIQYSSLSVSEWRARHDWYVAHGIRDVWLWGHAGHHVKQASAGSETEPPRFKINDVHRAMLATGERCLYWINPLTEQIASAYVPRGHEDHPGLIWRTFVTQDDNVVCFALDRLEPITNHRTRGQNALSPAGLFTKSWLQIKLESQLQKVGYDVARLPDE